MVQRSSILLRGAVLFFCGISCAPETLKIHVPPTGVHSVNQEDLRRAYWALESGDDPEQWWLKRTEQFHLEPSYPVVMYIREKVSTGLWSTLRQPQCN